MHRADPTVFLDDLIHLHHLVLSRIKSEPLRISQHADERCEERGFTAEILRDIVEHGDPDWAAIRLLDGRPALRIWADIRLTDESGRVVLKEAAAVVAMSRFQGIDVVTAMWRDERAAPYPPAVRRTACVEA